MLILLAQVGWGVAEGQMKATERTVVVNTTTPEVLSPLKEAQRVLDIINEIEGNFSFKADVDAVECGGRCDVNCAKSHCYVQCGNARPICFCDADGYAFCGCYAKCFGSQDGTTGETGEGSSAMGIGGARADAPNVKITPMAGGVRVESQKEVAVRVWDVLGRLVYSGKVRGVKVIPLKKGVFFVRVGKEIKKVLIR